MVDIQISDMNNSVNEMLGLFDDYANIVLDDAKECKFKVPAQERPVGRILLRGDNVALIQMKDAADGGSSTATNARSDGDRQ